MAMPFYVNGRVLQRAHGGRARYARHVVEHLPDAIVVMPRGDRGRWSGRVWEQSELLARTGNGVVLNMGHSGPMSHPRQVNVIHHLFSITHPESMHPARAALVQELMPRLISNASELVAVSDLVADQIADRFAVDRADIHIVPPGIDERFSPIDRRVARTRLELDPDRPVAAALLDPMPRKNSTGVVEVLRRAQDAVPGLQVVVAGRRQLASSGHRRRASLHASRTGFTDLGPAADAVVAGMYQAADVLLSLSHAEGFGLGAVEAASAGATVVTTPIPSIVEHTPNGAVIVADADAALTEVVSLLHDPSRRARISAVARADLAPLRWSTTAQALGSLVAACART